MLEASGTTGGEMDLRDQHLGWPSQAAELADMRAAETGESSSEGREVAREIALGQTAAMTEAQILND